VRRSGRALARGEGRGQPWELRIQLQAGLVGGLAYGLGRWGHRLRRWRLAEAQVARASAAPAGTNQAALVKGLVE